MNSVLFEWHAGTKGSADRAGLLKKQADERLISSAVLVLFFLALNSWKGKFSPGPLILSGCRENTFVSPFKMQPYSRKHSGSCWQIWPCRGCSHFLLLVLPSRFFIILHIAVNTALTSVKPQTLSLSHSCQQFQPFSRCLRDGITDGTKAGGQRAHIFICRRLIGQVYLEGTETQRAFSGGTSPYTPLPPRLRLDVSVCEHFKGLARAGTGPGSAGGPLQPNRSQLWPQRPLNDVIWEGVLQPPEACAVNEEDRTVKWTPCWFKGWRNLSILMRICCFFLPLFILFSLYILH